MATATTTTTTTATTAPTTTTATATTGSTTTTTTATTTVAGTTLSTPPSATAPSSITAKVTLVPQDMEVTYKGRTYRVTLLCGTEQVQDQTLELKALVEKTIQAIARQKPGFTNAEFKIEGQRTVDIRDHIKTAATDIDDSAPRIKFTKRNVTISRCKIDGNKAPITVAEIFSKKVAPTKKTSSSESATASSSAEDTSSIGTYSKSKPKTKKKSSRKGKEKEKTSKKPKSRTRMFTGTKDSTPAVGGGEPEIDTLSSSSRSYSKEGSDATGATSGSDESGYSADTSAESSPSDSASATPSESSS